MHQTLCQKEKRKWLLQPLHLERVRLTIHPYTHASIHPPMHSSMYPSIHPYIHLCMHPSIHVSIHPPMHASIHPPSIQPCIYPFSHAPTHTSIHHFPVSWSSLSLRLKGISLSLGNWLLPEWLGQGWKGGHSLGNLSSLFPIYRVLTPTRRGQIFSLRLPDA